MRSFEDIANYPVHVPGRGVITTEIREKAEFLLCYNGEVVTADEGQHSEEKTGDPGTAFSSKRRENIFGET